MNASDSVHQNVLVKADCVGAPQVSLEGFAFGFVFFHPHPIPPPSEISESSLLQLFSLCWMVKYVPASDALGQSPIIRRHDRQQRGEAHLCRLQFITLQFLEHIPFQHPLSRLNVPHLLCEQNVAVVS